MKWYAILFAWTLAIGVSYASPNSSLPTSASPTCYATDSQENWPQWLRDWVQYGGPMPDQLVTEVIHAAAGWGSATLEETEATMTARYYNGSLTIQLEQGMLPTLGFRVSCGGTAITVILDNY